MKNDLRSWRNLWPAVLILVLIMAFSVVLLREGRLRDLDVARLGSLETATLIAEDIGEDEGIRELPSSVRGWGIYSPEGSLIDRWGSAPENLGNHRTPQIVSESSEGSVLRTVRTMLFSVTATGGGSRGRGMGMRRQVLIDWDLKATGNPGFWRIAGVAGFTLLAVMLLLMQQLSARRVADYRSKEADQRRLVQLGMAARTLTHEIRNPLGVLMAQQALLKKTLSPDQADNLIIIAEEVERLSALTDRVREWLADPSGNPRLFNPSEVLASILERQYPNISVDTSAENSAENATIRMDPELFASVITNLVRNAVESQEGMAVSESPELFLRSHGKVVIIDICDRGKGLPEGDPEQIFDPFFTTKIKGSGVGLALSRQLVEAAGGTLELRNRSSGGVRATITLPEERA